MSREGKWNWRRADEEGGQGEGRGQARRCQRQGSALYSIVKRIKHNSHERVSMVSI